MEQQALCKDDFDKIIKLLKENNVLTRKKEYTLEELLRLSYSGRNKTWNK
jgi:hypothetical protein